MRRANLRANDFGCFPHLLPDPTRRCIHIKQAYLLATLTPKAIDADCPQEARLSRLEQVRSHAHGGSILDVLHVLRALRNDLIAQNCRGVFRDKAAKKIIRRGTGVILQGAHAAPRMESQ